MNSSDLDDFLNSDLSSKIFADKIAKEVADYTVLMTKKGATIPIHFHEDRDIVISKSTMAKLLTETLQGNISSIALAYICDCLTLGEHITFDDEHVEDLVFDLADPEINGGFKTQTDLTKLLNEM